uniref:Uncharacterized protein n=1 Tax=Setaria digitata TaxID=48799 RepID=A0A915PU83_9BILA
MASIIGFRDDINYVSWPLIKYTKLVGTRLEIPVVSGQTMAIIYNKNRCYLSVIFNSSTLEEFSLAVNPRPTIRSRERDIFVQLFSANGTTLTRFRIKFTTLADHASFVEFISFFVKVLPPSNMNVSSDFSQPLSQGCTEIGLSQESSQLSLFSSESSSQKSMTTSVVLPPEPSNDFYSMKNPTIYNSSACSADEKIYELLIPMKNPAVEHCCNTSETYPSSFTQDSGSKILNRMKSSKTVDQIVPSNTGDDPGMDLWLATQFSATSNKSHDAQENRRNASVQTDHCVSVNDLLNDSSQLMEYLTAKLHDQQFMQLAEKCSQVYNAIFRTVEGTVFFE